MNQPIRVLNVLTIMDRGGAETMVMNYYRNIDRSKVQFDFLVHRDQRGAYDDEIESLGGIIYRLPRLNPWSRNYRVALNRFFEEHSEYRIVHVHQDCMSSVILKAAERHRVPVRIAHSHNANQDKNYKYPIKLLYRMLIPKYATELIACGEQAGNWMFRGKPYRIMNNAINIDAYTMDATKRTEIRNQLNLNDCVVVGHVGRFNPQKNHSFLLEVFSKVLNRSPKAMLMLVGGGDDMPKIQNMAYALGIADHVCFLGVRSNIAELMQAMDVFVLPSLYEGLPVTMVEAQAAGLPCVISDCVPKECILTDGLVDVVSLHADIETWIQSILRKSELPHTDHKKEIALRGFNITTEVAKLQEFYLNTYEENC